MEMQSDQQQADWSWLTGDLLRRIAEELDPSEVASSLKLLNKFSATALGGTYRYIVLGRKVVWRPASPPVPMQLVARQPWPRGAFPRHWGRPEPWARLTLPQRRLVLQLAASSGDPHSLTAALENCGCSVTYTALVAAAVVGDSEACQRLLHDEGCSCPDEVFEAAAYSGSLDVLRVLRGLWPAHAAEAASLCDAVAVAAASFGHANVLDWLEDEFGGGPSILNEQNASRIGDGPWPVRDVDTVRLLACGAAAGGLTQVLERVLPALEAEPFNQQVVLEAMARGRCPLELLQRQLQAWFGWGSRPRRCGVTTSYSWCRRRWAVPLLTGQSACAGWWGSGNSGYSRCERRVRPARRLRRRRRSRRRSRRSCRRRSRQRSKRRSRRRSSRLRDPSFRSHHLYHPKGHSRPSHTSWGRRIRRRLRRRWRRTQQRTRRRWRRRWWGRMEEEGEEEEEEGEEEEEEDDMELDWTTISWYAASLQPDFAARVQHMHDNYGVRDLQVAAILAVQTGCTEALSYTASEAVAEPVPVGWDPQLFKEMLDFAVRCGQVRLGRLGSGCETRKES